MEKMKRTAGGLDVFFKILQGLDIAGLIMLVISDVIGLTMGIDKIVDVGGQGSALRVGGIVIQPDELAPMLDDFKGVMLIVSLLAAVCLVTVWVGLHMIRGILAPIKEGDPFRTGTADSIRKFGWFFVISTIIITVCSQASSVAVYNAFFKRFAQGSEYSVTFRMDLTFIVIVFIIFLISHVFRYGEELETRASEAERGAAPLDGACEAPQVFAEDSPH